MMSHAASEGVPPRYETLVSNTPSAVPVPNAPVVPSVQSFNSPPPMYYVSPSTQTRSVPIVAQQWHPSTTVSQNINTCLPFFQTFLKGKPKALGILVIVAAILEIGLGIALLYTAPTITLPSGIPFWGSVAYIIAGSLTISAQKKPSTCLIRGSLGLNIVSSIFSITAVILNIVDFIIITFNYCYYYGDYDGYYNNNYYSLCQQKHNGAYAVISLLLVINLLLFCVTVSTSAFGCRSLSKEQSVTQVFVIQNDVVLGRNPGAIAVTNTYTQPPLQPPPYTVNVVKA